MGDGRSYAAYVSFLVFQLRQSSLAWCFSICLVICFGICFVDFFICTYVYGCKYCHELSYKAPISGMGVMSLCCHVIMLLCWFAFNRVIIVNTASSYVIKLHG